MTEMTSNYSPSSGSDTSRNAHARIDEPRILADVFIPGRARPQGSLRPVRTKAGRLAVIHSVELTEYRRLVADALAEHWADQPAHTGPCHVGMVVTMVRPLAHYWPVNRRRAVPELRDDAPRYPIGHQTGDVDKLARTVLDAITAAGIWTDDAQAARLDVDKIYPATDMPGPASLHLMITAMA